MAIRIVTDSASDLPPEIAQRYDVTVIPCYVIIGDRDIPGRHQPFRR